MVEIGEIILYCSFKCFGTFGQKFFLLASFSPVFRIKFLSSSVLGIDW